MVGMVCWSRGKVRLERGRVQGLPVLQVHLTPGGRWEGRRLDKAARLLARQGVRRVLPLRGFARWDILERWGLASVDPLPLYRVMGAELALAVLKRRGVEPCRGAVALLGECVDADLARAARLLCPWVRTLMLGVEYGGERLARELYWEFGAVVGVGGEADVRVRFSGTGQPGELVLWGKPELLGLELEAPGLELPEELEPLPVLTALWQAGLLTQEALWVTSPINSLDIR